MPATKFSNLVPKPDYVSDKLHKKGNTQDIINTVLYAYHYNDHQPTREMRAVADELKQDDGMDTLYAVWNFVRKTIKYKADEPGHEKIKSPAYLYHFGIGDCKSFSLMIAAILSNYKDVGFSFRFTSYNPGSDFSHVYIVAKLPGIKKEIILDSTISDFNYEAAYVRKKDYPMTQISHLHGPPAYVRGARPTVAQAFANGPQRSVLPYVDIRNITQGELTLKLLEAQLTLRENYYGDPNKFYAEAKNILRLAQKDLINYSPSGSIRPEHNDLIRMIQSAKGRHISQVQAIVNMANEFQISGSVNWRKMMSENDLVNCIKNTNPPRKTIWDNDYIDYNGIKYDYQDNSNPEWTECIRLAIQKEWARNNIFGTEKWNKGSHTLLYEFIDQTKFAKYLNVDGAIKKNLHKTYIDGLSLISGLDRNNVSLYTRNGIEYHSTLKKLTEISPEYNIEGLADPAMRKAAINVVDPATVTLILGIISIAYTAFKDAMAPKQQELLNFTKVPITDSGKAGIDDFNSQISTAETVNSLLPIAAAVAAAVILFTPSNSKS